MIKKWVWSIITVLFFCFQYSYAQVSTHIDRRQVALGESLTLTINLDNANQQPNLDPLNKDFTVYGTSTSSQTSIINGKKTSNISYIVTLMPKQIGTQEIPAIDVGGEKTTPIQLTVTKPSTKDMGGEQSNLFLETSLSSKNVYVNAPVLYTLKLYYATSISDISIQPINIPNVEIKPFGKNTQYQATRNGKTYQVVEQNFLMTASQEGELFIPAAEIKAAVIQSNSNTFFGMQSSKPVMVKSKPLSIHIKPVPKSVPLGEWLPATGLSLKESWSKKGSDLKVGDPITRTIILSATGAEAKDLPNLQITVPNNANGYPDKSQSNDFIDNGQPAATKTFKIAYVPTSRGKLVFPEIQVHWWNTDTDSMMVETIPAKTFEVAAGKVLAHADQSVAAEPFRETPSKAKVSVVQSLFWFYMAMIFAALWLITSVILVWKKAKGKLKSPGSPDQSPVLRGTINEIQNACHKRDLKRLSDALVAWASIYFNAEIYTVRDIQPYVDSDKFKGKLSEINASLYSEKTFEGYDDLWAGMTTILKRNIVKNRTYLNDFYPE